MIFFIEVLSLNWLYLRYSPDEMPRARSTLGASSRQLLQHAVDIFRGDVEMGRGAHPSGAGGSSDAPAAQAVHDLNRVSSRFAKAHNAGAGFGGPLAHGFVT